VTLRSLCRLCHDACTALEYSHFTERRRVDPADSNHRSMILRQIKRLLSEQQKVRRCKMLNDRRKLATDYFIDMPDSWVAKDI
jgi:formate hydrogenlyase subunit 6/NADH:ubiquinone oxidoreductase subunit I